MDNSKVERLTEMLQDIYYKIAEEEKSDALENPMKAKNIEKLNMAAAEVRQRIAETGAVEENKLTNKARKKRKKKMWSSITILMVIVAIVVFITMILGNLGIEVEIPGTDGGPTTIGSVEALGLADIFMLPIKGFMNQVQIIIFILMIGAFITVVISTKALEGMAQRITMKLKGKEIYAIIPLFTFFSFMGSVEGMAEESIAFYAVCIPLLLMAGFDTFTSLLVIFGGVGLGAMAATLCPFSVSIAIQNLLENGITGLSIGDGLIMRVLVWTLFTAAGIAFTMMYARKVKRNPQLSVVFQTREKDNAFFLSQTNETIQMTWKRKLTLIVFFLSFILMVVYLINWGSLLGMEEQFQNAAAWADEHLWFISGIIPGFGINEGYLPEVASFFLIAAIVLGVINGMGEKGFMKEFMNGAADFVGVVLVISVAAGVAAGLDASNLKYLITAGLENSISSFDNDYVKILILFFFFVGISFLIPSTSGFATLVFPLIVPIVSTESVNAAGETVLVAIPGLATGAILAFVLANGFVNLFSPMSTPLVGGLQVAKIDYLTYLKTMWKPLIVVFLMIIGSLMLNVALAKELGAPSFVA
ncbi:YfcC family protein [Mesoplasma photuris]|uniref:YfcC family protein n=1 Tax=Mesoplasma photuris TaxID=217731 RepID=UPI00068C1896|nr:YfcC family protein [Mesoplasma photuris]